MVVLCVTARLFHLNGGVGSYETLGFVVLEHRQGHTGTERDLSWG